MVLLIVTEVMYGILADVKIYQQKSHSTFLNDSFMYMYLKYLTLFPNIFPTFAKCIVLETSMLKRAHCDLISPR